MESRKLEELLSRARDSVAAGAASSAASSAAGSAVGGSVAGAAGSAVGSAAGAAGSAAIAPSAFRKPLRQIRSAKSDFDDMQHLTMPEYGPRTKRLLERLDKLVSKRRRAEHDLQTSQIEKEDIDPFYSEAKHNVAMDIKESKFFERKTPKYAMVPEGRDFIGDGRLESYAAPSDRELNFITQKLMHLAKSSRIPPDLIVTPVSLEQRANHLNIPPSDDQIKKALTSLKTGVDLPTLYRQLNNVSLPNMTTCVVQTSSDVFNFWENLAVSITNRSLLTPDAQAKFRNVSKYEQSFGRLGIGPQIFGYGITTYHHGQFQKPPFGHGWILQMRDAMNLQHFLRSNSFTAHSHQYLDVANGIIHQIVNASQCGFFVLPQTSSILIRADSSPLVNEGNLQVHFTDFTSTTIPWPAKVIQEFERICGAKHATKTLVRISSYVSLAMFEMLLRVDDPTEEKRHLFEVLVILSGKPTMTAQLFNAFFQVHLAPEDRIQPDVISHIELTFPHLRNIAKEFKKYISFDSENNCEDDSFGDVRLDSSFSASKQQALREQWELTRRKKSEFI